LAENPDARRTNPSTPASATSCHPQIAHPKQVVGREREDKLKVQCRGADKPSLAQAADGLGPAKAFLDPVADALADGITGVAGGALIDRR